MIDTDKYEEQLEDDNTDTWVVWRIAKESIEEVKRLRDIADTCLHAIKAGGDIRSGTIMLIERNLKLMEMKE